ncbi:hypothetical protein G6F57_012627 [Rhizopus arrhizus]|uniref:AN1-type domain-containing protein n=1 Tax=Rhizopus oryzae TaxID=64495 RepID=A0A9P7BM27_RHIOR|nr:hypothetical protein G6F23_009978 [Rhizopus arrhizus]KAG1400229.1 hypothetical protein G6F58_010986 [Rhizopus delemar]KAG0755038.1 hypothetical protein G6F24_012101 [Rhizopus arrhizus]KAG0781129.1 hypothetical protein G6F21_011804 [Rhizopus arrhizus]KAG0783143.1 hypothetical protein G6F22_008809 [Rhizopus arrhizus]
MELPQVGKNCNLENCNSLDFLPITCPFCQKTFCGEHRLPLNHNCSQWNRVDKQLIQCVTCSNLIKAPEQPNLSPKEALEEHLKSNCKIHLYALPDTINFDRNCSVQGCSSVDPHIGRIYCEGCGQDYCLKHRHPSTHNCECLFADEKRKLERKLAAQEKMAKTLKLPDSSTRQKIIKPIPAKSKKGSIVELMKMRTQAKGDSSIPPASRMYLYVQCPKTSNMGSLSVFFDKKSSIGRMLDALANMCNITNRNNMISATDPERLYLYKCPEMTIIDNSMMLEKAVKNLDTLLLERQGDVTSSEE